MQYTLSINTTDTHKLILTIKKDGEKKEKVVDATNKRSETIVPQIEIFLQEQGLKLDNLTEIEVATGPGSFTGLRVGATVAQTLALLLNIPLNGKPPGTSPDLIYGEDTWKIQER